MQASSVFVADDMKDVAQEMRESSSTMQQSSPDTTAQNDQTQMETILETRARNNLHFILCVSPVSPAY